MTPDIFAASPSFFAKGSCIGDPDPDLWFPKDGHSSTRNREREAEARKICSTCPVRSECLTYAIENRETGIWGGTDEAERRLILRRMRRKGEAPPAPKRGLAPCGTPAAARRHWRRGEPACMACAEAANLARIARRAKGPVTPRQPVEHGTRRGYEAHMRLREQACDACATVRAEYQREQRAAAKRRAA